MNRMCKFILWYTFLFVKNNLKYILQCFGVKAKKYMTLKIMKLSAKMVKN